jgi:hypothetical protein
LQQCLTAAVLRFLHPNVVTPQAQKLDHVGGSQIQMSGAQQCIRWPSNQCNGVTYKANSTRAAAPGMALVLYVYAFFGVVWDCFIWHLRLNYKLKDTSWRAAKLRSECLSLVPLIATVAYKT